MNLSIDDSIICLGRNDIDITDEEKLAKILDACEIKSIINASAYTAVDKAESEHEQAFELNKVGVENLARYAAGRDIHLVHVSTDYVFSGDKGAPYLVDEPYAPIGIYGASKAAGEKALLDICPQASCILRTSWVYSRHGNNFVKTMLRLMGEKAELGVIDDQIGSPTSASALAQACFYAAAHRVVGIHHFTDAGVSSWYDFALAIQEMGLKYALLNKAIPVKPIPTSAYPTPAKRPSYSVLDKSTLKDGFAGLQPKHWREELELVVKQLA
jgi:dTDP-4-dehydrorhamnose reductase